MRSSHTLALAAVLTLLPVAVHAQSEFTTGGADPKTASDALKGITPIPTLASLETREVYTRVTGPNMVTILQDTGYRAELDVDGVGDPLIHSTTEGINYSISFYGCNDQPDRACDSLLFSAGFDLRDGATYELINEWNRAKRFGKAYLDHEMDPFIEMNLTVDGGITADNLKDWLSWWSIALAEFKQHIDW